MVPVDKRPSLLDLAASMGTDKASHGYAPFYESLFSPRRDEPLRILELGVGGFDEPEDPAHGGESLRTWKAYFPRATIVGLDLLDKHAVAEDRVHVVQGSQVDEGLLADVVSSHGPFDIVIDDASHISSLTNRSFEIPFPLLADDGIYVIEDIGTSYWPMWGGRFGRRGRGTSMALVKDRLDGLNHAELKLPNVVPSALDRTIVEVRARHGIVAFVKGRNDIPSDLNHPHPISSSAWLSTDLLPVLVTRAKHPAVMRTLKVTGLLPAAGWVRRRVVPEVRR